MSETIVAIASPVSPAPRGIVRLSGEDTCRILRDAGIEAGTRTRRFSTSLDVSEPLGVLPVDVLVWPSGRCYTGEPSAELHTLGSLPLLTAIVDRMIHFGARAARPGEFTLRAFLGGRLDLVQAEAVLGVIEAEGRGALDAALTQLAGNVSTPLEAARGELLDLLADVEAGLDFVDEDIEFVSDEVLADRLKQIALIVSQTQGQLQTRSGGADVPVITFRGLPNAGKSCLLNAISDSDTSIVTPVAGTTRDRVRVSAVLGDQPVVYVDTAGIEPEIDTLTRAMSRQSSHQDKQSDIRIWCVDANADDADDQAQEILQTASATSRKGAVDVFVATKSDLVDVMPRFVSQPGDQMWIACSGQTGESIDTLKTTLADCLDQTDRQEQGSVMGTAARCRGALTGAGEAIAAAIDATINQVGHEFVATEMRQAAASLGEVTGAVYTDDILDRVFSRFCIGK